MLRVTYFVFVILNEVKNLKNITTRKTKEIKHLEE